MAAIERFEAIRAWQLGRELCARVYALCCEDGISRDWGLRDQIMRAAGSVMHNIAERFDAGSDAEFVRFLGYARRSRTEVQRALCVALDQGCTDHAAFPGAYALAGDARAAIAGYRNCLRHSARSA